MKVDIKKLPQSQAELTIEISVFELQPFITNTAASMSKELKIAGFRPGKAPYDMVKQQVGEAQIYQEALDEIIRKTYPRAVIEHDLEAVGQPKISVEKLASGNPLIYKAVVTLLPKIELGDYKKTKSRRKPVKVEPKEIDLAIRNLQKMFGKEIQIDRPAQKGDKVEVDFDVFLDSVPLEGGQSKKHPLVLGEGQFIPGFEENLMGMVKEQVREFKLRFPKDYHKKDLANRLAEFKVRMQAIYKIELPKIDDEFAKTVGQFESFSAMQKQMSDSIEKEKSLKEEQRFEREILDEIIDRSKFSEIPVLLITSELEKMMAEFEADISHQGLKFDDYLKSLNKSKEEFKKQLTPQAEKRIKSALVIRHIAKKEKIKVSPEEIEKEISQSKEKYQSRPEVLKELETPEYKMYLSNFLASKKVMELLKSFVS